MPNERLKDRLKAEALASASRAYTSLEIIRQERKALKRMVMLYDRATNAHTGRRDAETFHAEIDGLLLREKLERELALAEDLE